MLYCFCGQMSSVILEQVSCHLSLTYLKNVLLYLYFRYGNANVWKIFTDLFDYFPLTALVSLNISFS